MSKTKQIIERALPFSHQYIYLDITRGSIENAQACTCDNCGKLITNMVHIVDRDTKKHYSIGTDCAETLATAKALYNNGLQTDYRTDIYSLNKAARVATELKKGNKHRSTDWLTIVTNDKGKEIDCFTNDLKKFFPELVPA